ncbi:MAG: RAD55 family ATPase, partial [Actinomycetota bacterium]
MTERITTGKTRLDTILGGGLSRNAINLVIGIPGSGKTILAQQCAFANATEDRPAVYFSTVSEPLEKMLRFGQGLTFFDVSSVGEQIVYEDLGSVLGPHGLDGVVDQVRECIRDRQPSMIVIDSFKALSAYGDESEFRQFLHLLTRTLSAFPVTSLWIGEYEPTDIAVAPEFAV